MTETPLLFGPDASLLGMLTRPADVKSSDLALLLFNSGVLSRVGPHRFNVKLARAACERNVTSLRFDLSGHGDSPSGEVTGDLHADAVRDIIAAMDHLQRHFGMERFAVLGVCSGAVQALSAALSDRRIVGLMMFDGHWYRSRWTRPVRHWKRLRSMSARQVAEKIWQLAWRVRSSGQVQASDIFMAQLQPANPPREQFVRSMQMLVDRRVSTHLVYSGSVIDFYSYRAQFRDVFGGERFYSAVRCDLRDDIDHTFASLESQRRMIQLVGGWIAVVKGRLDSLT